MKRFASFLAAIFLALSALGQEYGVVDISVCNLRRTADFDAEMVSQALLGTPVHILQTSRNGNPWPQVQTPDGYTGWVHYAAVKLMSREEYHAWNAAPKVVVTALFGTVYDRPSAKGATVSDLVGGDRLKYLGRKGNWLKVGFPGGREGYVSRKEAMPEADWRKRLDTSPEAILKTAQSMLGFPYLWAGMSPKGMDCSGFVRTVLFMHDIIIPRDSGPMSKVGARIQNKEELVPGDLVFFGSYREDGTPRVSHVGFYLGEGRFIHSLGLVQIGSFRPEDPLYDAFNTGRYLFGGIILPYIDIHEGLNTTLSNPYYAE
jgi:cell wall-associated NlpC family hydrolase